MARYANVLAVACVTLLTASPAFAADRASADAPPAAEAPGTSVHRLSDEKVEEILAAAAERREAVEEPDRKIHGEFGVEVGTGGYRAAYGSALLPLGRNGAAAVSFETSRNDPYSWYEGERRWRR